MSKKENLLGQRFGKWTVIATAEQQNKRTMWLCRCDCGNEKAVNSSNLKRGLSTSCGCEKPGECRDITGQQFGKLTAIKIARKTKKSTVWLCRCDCGNEVEVIAGNLASGHTTSCGCSQKAAQKDATARVEALKISPLTGRFETNKEAKCWRLRSPSGVIYELRNLSKFIRDNSELFGIDGTNDKSVSKVLKGLSDAKAQRYCWFGWQVEEITEILKEKIPKKRSSTSKK